MNVQVQTSEVAGQACNFRSSKLLDCRPKLPDSPARTSLTIKGACGSAVTHAPDGTPFQDSSMSLSPRRPRSQRSAGVRRRGLA